MRAESTGRLIAALVLCGAASLHGCERPAGRQTQAIDVSGEMRSVDLALIDHTGTARTLKDFRGRIVVVFFGFTQCPDICPTTLTDAAATLKRLGADARRVQVVFVTVDPERDSQKLLAEYVPAFDPGFLGLRGSPEATAKVIKDFKVFVRKVPGKTPDSYNIDHTAYTYLVDANGRVRLKVPHSQGPDALAGIIRDLLADG